MEKSGNRNSYRIRNNELPFLKKINLIGDILLKTILCETEILDAQVPSFGHFNRYDAMQ